MEFLEKKLKQKLLRQKLKQVAIKKQKLKLKQKLSPRNQSESKKRQLDVDDEYGSTSYDDDHYYDSIPIIESSKIRNRLKQEDLQDSASEGDDDDDDVTIGILKMNNRLK
ncbi:hypothetical protein C5167_047398 [Papaver somniferum]|uniref:Uncharacterized protein n=1 Tax=Papaver somniferum TaxID=3469 RepID=A0A4Y7LJ18_PAPSO|nr:hypothetical protein C5167_047398 [Papaver somniferum]